MSTNELIDKLRECISSENGLSFEMRRQLTSNILDNIRLFNEDDSDEEFRLLMLNYAIIVDTYSDE